MERANEPEGTQTDPWFANGLRFKCTACGECCTGTSGSVFLSPDDLGRLAAFFELSPDEFAQRYTREVDGLRALLDREGTSDCVFLSGKLCTVYEARPTQCGTFPFWFSNVVDPESWEKTAESCEGINHPEAPVVPYVEILTQCELDWDNEGNLGQ